MMLVVDNKLRKFKAPEWLILSTECLPANASCLMKKFILDLRLFRYKVIKTAEFPSTMVKSRIHNTVNCSVCGGGRERKGKVRLELEKLFRSLSLAQVGVSLR